MDPGESSNGSDGECFEAWPLAGTETAAYYPFFSPDSERIAFTTTGQLKTLPVGGGEPRVICNFDGIFGGGSWSSDDLILFSSQTALHLVPANGGNPEVLLDLGPPYHASKPELLFTRRFYVDTTRQQTYDVSPDGERFLVVEELQGKWSEEVVVVMNWSEELKRLVPVE